MNRRTTRETEMIRNARLRLGYSQQQVATLIGMPVRQYQRFEYGETEIQRINIRAGLALCAVLELDPVSLVFNGRADALSELAQQRPSKGKMQVRHKDIPQRKRSPKRNEILGWDESFSYRAPATVRTRDGETIIFFDLDNYVGVPLRQKDAEKNADEAEREEPKVYHEDTRGIFYGAEDDEPQEVTDTEDMERRLREIAEYEKRHFGAPAFEHDGNVRLPAIDDDGEWEVMVPARVLGDDHRVDVSVVEALQDEMMDAMIDTDDVDDAESEADDEEGGAT